MSKKEQNSNDLIGDEWKTNIDNTSEAPSEEAPNDVSFYEESMVSDRLNSKKETINSIIDKALDRNLLETNKLGSEIENSNLGKTYIYTLFIKNEIFSKNNRSAIIYFFIGIIALLVSIYFFDEIIASERKYRYGSAIIIGLLIKQIITKLKHNIHAFDINPSYIKIGKGVISENTNTSIFFNTILGISFNIDDFENINSSSKIDNTIQFIKNNEEEQSTFPYSKLHLCYEGKVAIKIISIDLDKVEVDTLQFMKLISALLRSNEAQRAHILNVMAGTAIDLNTEIVEDNQNEQDDIIERSKGEIHKPVDVVIEEDTNMKEHKEPSPNNSSDKQNYEVCYNRPGNIMFSGKKDVVKINPVRIFLDYGICNEEDDIDIAFDDIIGIAYDEYEAKQGVSEETRDLEAYLNSNEDEEISIYHKQGDRFVNTKVYIYKTETKKGELFAFILLLNRHNVEERKKILQIQKTELEE